MLWRLQGPRGRAKDPSLCWGLTSSILASSRAGWTLGRTWDCPVCQCESLLLLPGRQSLRDPDVRTSGQAYCAHPAPGPPTATCQGGDLVGPFCPLSGSPQSCLRALTLVHQGPDILPSALMRPCPLSQVPSFSEARMSGCAAVLIPPYGLPGPALFWGPGCPQSSLRALTLTPRRTWDSLLCPPETPPLIPPPQPL